MSSPPGDESTSRKDDAFLAYLYARAEEEIIPAHPDYNRGGPGPLSRPSWATARPVSKASTRPPGRLQPGSSGRFRAPVPGGCESGGRPASRWHASADSASGRKQKTPKRPAGVRIPVAGAASAGKTRFLYASLNSLLLTAAQARIPVSFPDQASQDHAGYGLDLIRSGQHAVKMRARRISQAFRSRSTSGWARAAGPA